MKNLIIIGAGTAGTTVANHLQTKLPSDWQLKVIDPEPRHLFQPDLIFLPFDMQTPEKMERPRKSTFRRDVEWLQKEVFAVDTDARQVVLDDDERLPKKDRPILRAAVLGRATHLITGDISRTDKDVCIGKNGDIRTI